MLVTALLPCPSLTYWFLWYLLFSLTLDVIVAEKNWARSSHIRIPFTIYHSDIPSNMQAHKCNWLFIPWRPVHFLTVSQNDKGAIIASVLNFWKGNRGARIIVLARVCTKNCCPPHWIQSARIIVNPQVCTKNVALPIGSKLFSLLLTSCIMDYVLTSWKGNQIYNQLPDSF